MGRGGMLEVTRTDGEVRHVDGTVSRLLLQGSGSQQQEVRVCLLRDITDQFRADEQLRGLAAAVRDASSALAILVGGSGGHRVQLVNPALVEIIGKVEEEGPAGPVDRSPAWRGGR